MVNINYTKAVLFFATGIIAIAVSRLLGSDNETYGFLTGYGYTALTGGVAGILYCYFKNKKTKA